MGDEFLEIWTDSSYCQEKKIAGIGLVIKRHGKYNSIPSWTPASSNNYGEMWAIHQAGVLAGGSKCIIYTDSQTALDYINGIRGKEYEAKHRSSWTKFQYYEHKRLQFLAYRIKRMSPNLSFEKVKAHQKDLKALHICNNMADSSAKLGVIQFLSR